MDWMESIRERWMASYAELRESSAFLTRIRARERFDAGVRLRSKANEVRERPFKNAHVKIAGTLIKKMEHGLGGNKRIHTDNYCWSLANSI
jgi:hypothetical protein